MQPAPCTWGFQSLVLQLALPCWYQADTPLSALGCSGLRRNVPPLRLRRCGRGAPTPRRLRMFRPAASVMSARPQAACPPRQQSSQTAQTATLHSLVEHCPTFQRHVKSLGACAPIGATHFERSLHATPTRFVPSHRHHGLRTKRASGIMSIHRCLFAQYACRVAAGLDAAGPVSAVTLPASERGAGPYFTWSVTR